MKHIMGNLKKMQDEINEITNTAPVIKVIMASRIPSDTRNKVYLNNEDITRYIRSINVDIGIDRITTATIVLSARAIIEAPVVLRAYIREEDRHFAEEELKGE